jgi:hypothetical protein
MVQSAPFALEAMPDVVSLDSGADRETRAMQNTPFAATCAWMLAM